jgi:hypothetical protein
MNLEDMRKPMFWIAFAAMCCVVLGELGSGLLAAHGVVGEAPKRSWGIPNMAFVDGLWLYLLVLTGLPMIIPKGIQGRAQGCMTLVLSLVLIICGILQVFVVLGYLVLMVALLLAAPFGTLVYLAGFGTFPTGAAAGCLSGVMFCKLLVVAFLFLAQQRFLSLQYNKSLILLIATSLLLSILTSFLHGFVPGFLVSITDALAALISVIVGVIWALFFLIFSIPAIGSSIG